MEKPMKNLIENKPQMCLRCGGQVELNVPDVKFCRFCGLSLTESRESAQGLTEIKQTGLKFSVWGYVILQILYLVVFLTIIPSLSIWSSIILLIVLPWATASLSPEILPSAIRRNIKRKAAPIELKQKRVRKQRI